MKTLWTPDGEKPISSSNNNTSDLPNSQVEDASDDQSMDEMIAYIREQILSTPINDLLINHCAGIAEIAAVHLANEEPDLDSARFAIDALAALVDSISTKLPEESKTGLSSLVSELRTAWVNVSSK